MDIYFNLPFHWNKHWGPCSVFCWLLKQSCFGSLLAFSKKNGQQLFPVTACCITCYRIMQHIQAKTDIGCVVRRDKHEPGHQLSTVWLSEILRNGKICAPSLSLCWYVYFIICACTVSIFLFCSESLLQKLENNTGYIKFICFTVFEVLLSLPIPAQKHLFPRPFAHGLSSFPWSNYPGIQCNWNKHFHSVYTCLHLLFVSLWGM